MKSNKKGFSFIEVVLVLGIAGLIFMMAFIALPSLWASQRDAERQSNVMSFISDLKTYQTNNSRGALPTGMLPATITPSDLDGISPSSGNGWGNFLRDYVIVGGAPEDPIAGRYIYKITECKDSNSNRDVSTGEACVDNLDGNNNEGVNFGTEIKSGEGINLYVVTGATCDGDRIVKTNSSRSAAAMQILERAGRYCYNT